MPRTTRTHAPGVGFHIIAVTQGRAKWFNDAIRRRICSDIDRAGDSYGHLVLARVVMPNHLHIIVRAGSTPLGWMMQRVLQRASCQVRRQHDLEGHVFMGRYWCEPIPTPKYLRRAIVYTHFNPCKASLCDQPGNYEFSLHNEYVACLSADATPSLGVREALMLFANESVNLQDAARNYLGFMDFCHDKYRLGLQDDWLRPGALYFGHAPVAHAGDQHWLDTYTSFEPEPVLLRTKDVEKLATSLLRQIDRALDLETLRFGSRLSALVGPRNQLIDGLLGANCRTSAIARFLCVSPSAVSKRAALMRESVFTQKCRSAP